jgi:hypothetical protein
VHLAHIGAPILGDPLYGDLSKDERALPIMLHARRVIIPISKNKDPATIEAPPPDWMAAMLARFEDADPSPFAKNQEFSHIPVSVAKGKTHN